MGILHIKKLIRNKVLLLSSLVYFVCLIYFFVQKNKNNTCVEDGLYHIIMVMPYIFIFFLFYSYELFWQINKHNMMELLREKRICLSVQKYDLMILIGFGFITAMIAGAFLYSNTFHFGLLTQAIVIYYLKIILLFVIFPCLVAIFMGWCASMIKNRIGALCFLLCMLYCFDDAFKLLIMGFDFQNETLFNVAVLFSVFNTEKIGAISDSFYQMSAENIHVFRYLFWILLSLSTIYYFAKKKIRFCISVSFAFICLIMNFIPSGASISMPVLNGFDRWHEPFMYYSTEVCNSIDESFSDKKEDFSVEHYDLDFSVMHDVLEAQAKMKISSDVCSEYRFTLYHRFQVVEVIDQNGEKLKYDQKFDYLTVYPSGKVISEINICYRGFSQFFFSTKQAICLPANFEYYPVPGWHKTFLDDSNLCFTQELPTKKSSFNIKLTCPREMNVCMNIDKQHEESMGYKKCIEFIGCTEAVTIVGSDWLGCMDINGVRVVYSKLDALYSPEEPSMKQQYEEFFQKYKFSKGVTYFATSEGNYRNVCFGADQIIDQVFKVEEDYQIFLEKGNTYIVPEKDDSEVQEAIDMLKENEEK